MYQSAEELERLEAIKKERGDRALLADHRKRTFGYDSNVRDAILPAYDPRSLKTLIPVLENEAIKVNSIRSNFAVVIPDAQGYKDAWTNKEYQNVKGKTKGDLNPVFDKGEVPHGPVNEHMAGHIRKIEHYRLPKATIKGVFDQSSRDDRIRIFLEGLNLLEQKVNDLAHNKPQFKTYCEAELGKINGMALNIIGVYGTSNVVDRVCPAKNFVEFEYPARAYDLLEKILKKHNFAPDVADAMRGFKIKLGTNTGLLKPAVSTDLGLNALAAYIQAWIGHAFQRDKSLLTETEKQWQFKQVALNSTLPSVRYANKKELQPFGIVSDRSYDMLGGSIGVTPNYRIIQMAAKEFGVMDKIVSAELTRVYMEAGLVVSDNITCGKWIYEARKDGLHVFGSDFSDFGPSTSKCVTKPHNAIGRRYIAPHLHRYVYETPVLMPARSPDAYFHIANTQEHMLTTGSFHTSASNHTAHIMTIFSYASTQTDGDILGWLKSNMRSIVNGDDGLKAVKKHPDEDEHAKGFIEYSKQMGLKATVDYDATFLMRNYDVNHIEGTNFISRAWCSMINPERLEPNALIRTVKFLALRVLLKHSPLLEVWDTVLFDMLKNLPIQRISGEETAIEPLLLFGNGGVKEKFFLFDNIKDVLAYDMSDRMKQDMLEFGLKSVTNRKILEDLALAFGSGATDSFIPEREAVKYWMLGTDDDDSFKEVYFPRNFLTDSEIVKLHFDFLAVVGEGWDSLAGQRIKRYTSLFSDYVKQSLNEALLSTKNK